MFVIINFVSSNLAENKNAKEKVTKVSASNRSTKKAKPKSYDGK